MNNKKSLEIEVGNLQSFLLEEGKNDLIILEEKGNFLKVLSNEKVYEIVVKSMDADHKNAVINVEGFDFTIKVNEPLDLLIKQMGFLRPAINTVKEIKAPMPGLVLDIFVQTGDIVAESQNLISLEAMKMENIIKSTGEGTVKEIKVVKGAAVDKNQILLVFE